MIRNIYVGDAYSRKVVTPLITSDCNSYKIIWDSKCTKGNFKITAIRADGTSSFDFGILSEEGVAEYIISNDMYNTEGPLKLLLAIVESDSITTCREINFTVKQGADETKFAENNINPINSLVMQMATDKTEVQEKVVNLQNYGTADVYLLKDGEDIKISDGVVEEFLKKDFSGCEAIAFPEGIYEIKLPNDGLRGTTDLVANKVIMPASLKTIGEFSFANFAEFDENDKLDEKSVRVKVREYVLNEGIEKIERSAFADNVFLEKVNIPYTLTEIERMTFGYTDNLEKIFIPATVVEIGHGNFTTSQLDGEYATVIYGYTGTEAERYAKNEHWLKEYENKFVNIGSDYSKQIDNKVDKENGKQLSTEDYTTAEKEKLEGLENYDDTPVKENTNKIDLLNKYGTTDVYVLQEGVDYTISNDVSSAHFRFSNGTIGTLINFNYANKTIVFPEGIIVIGESRLSNLTAKGVIMPSSLVEIKEDAFANTTSLQSVKFNDNNITDILIGSYAFFGCTWLKKIKLSSKIHFNFDSAVFSGTVIEGYAGSDAEKYCEKYGNDFINIGSDYSERLGDIETALDSILTIQNELIGGDSV